MKRFLKRRINPFLPAGLRASIKQRIAAKFAEPVERTFVVEETGSAVRCKIDNGWSFLAPLICKSDLVTFTQTPAGRAELSCIADAAKAGGVLFDIGSHRGLISALFCSANPQNGVVSFEPSPVLAEGLRALRDLNQFGARMCIEQIGIGASSGTAKMIVDPVGGFVQAQHFDHTMWALPQPIEIRIETLSDAAARLGVIPRFIKMDIEGYEFEAIKGALEFIARHRPTIFLELHLDYLDQRNLSAKSLVAMLLECRYALYTSGGTKLKPRDVYDSPLAIIRIIAR